MNLKTDEKFHHNKYFLISGTNFLCSQVTAPIRNEEGEISMFIMNFEDITDAPFRDDVITPCTSPIMCECKHNFTLLTNSNSQYTLLKQQKIMPKYKYLYEKFNSIMIFFFFIEIDSIFLIKTIGECKTKAKFVQKCPRMNQQH